MNRMDDLADALALESLELEERTGNENLVARIGEALGSSSPTMEEIFLTAVRVRRAERRARRKLDEFRAAADPAALAPPPAAAE